MNEESRKNIISEKIILFVDICRKVFSSDVWKDIFIPTLLFGVLVHFTVLACGLYNHDSITLPYNDFDWLLQQGKWFVTPLASLEGEFDIGYLSMIIGILFLTLSAGLFCIICDIKRKIYRVIVGFTIVSFPSVACMALYHAADYFCLAFFLSVLGAYFIVADSYICNIVGVILVSLSVGAYQPYIGVSLSVLAIHMILVILKKYKASVLRAVRYVICEVFALIAYYIILKIRLVQEEMGLSDYKGMNAMADNLSPITIIRSAILAYRNYVNFLFRDVLGIYESELSVLALLLTAIAVLWIIYKLRQGNYSLWEILSIFFILFICIPLCVNFAGVLSQNSSFYMISVFPFVISYVMVFAIAQNAEKDDAPLSNGMRMVTITVVMLLCFGWFREDNVVYHIAEGINREWDVKIPGLADRMLETDGFSDQPVAFIGDTPYAFLTSKGILAKLEQTYNCYFFGLGENEVYSEVILCTLMNNRYAYGFALADKTYVMTEYGEEIASMPIYPAEGSIAIMGDSLIVKLNEISK